MERVRQAQAEKASGIHHFPHRFIDPGTGIDAHQEDHTGLGNGVVCALINGERLSPKHGRVIPGSVSIAPGRSGPPPTNADIAVEHARDLWWPAEHLRGLCREAKRRGEDGSENFYHYAVAVDGVDFKVIARSESDARSIVKRIWRITRPTSA